MVTQSQATQKLVPNKQQIKAYTHLLGGVIIYLGELQRRLSELNNKPSLNSSITKPQITLLANDTIRLLHSLEPCIPYAKETYPELLPFLESCEASIIRIKKDYGITEPHCDCKGCQL